jgi:DNA-binding transcriptional regulator PaaX
MGRNDTTSQLIDEILRFGAISLALGATMIAPNIMIGLKKPLDSLFQHLDKQEREREIRRTLYYMKERGYLAGEYEHGLQLTDKARERLARIDAKLIATPQDVWDGWWRIIIYDIPNELQSARHALQNELRRYGCYILQRSVYITPFPCIDDIQTLAARCGADKYVTHFEAKNLPNAAAMIRLFKKKYPNTKFQ